MPVLTAANPPTVLLVLYTTLPAEAPEALDREHECGRDQRSCPSVATAIDKLGNHMVDRGATQGVEQYGKGAVQLARGGLLKGRKHTSNL